MAKALCHIHHRLIHPHLADQLSSAFDSFLEIQRHIHQLENEALQRPSDWAQKNVFLVAMDGNNSLKLVDSTFQAGNEHADARISNSTHWITPEDVNMFKDEVSKKSSHRQPATSDTPPNIPAIPTLSSSRKAAIEAR
ncbi:hypothetical protein BJ165DRAFT_1410660 [Panaeolus papilionaceus]|nr:hypothetical protein BJ165DRAFT_1410660 [Panaeolus papilionaceus]